MARKCGKQNHSWTTEDARARSLANLEMGRHPDGRPISRGRPFEVGHPFYGTPESIERVAAAHRGKPRPQHVRDKIAAAQRGKKKSPEEAERLRRIATGRKQSLETIEKKRQSRAGYRHSEETRRKMAETKRQKAAGKFKAKDAKRLRRGIEFSLWREAVFRRDGWTCQKCGVRGGNLHPHHIENFADYPELRFEVTNGITLCYEHHKAFHVIYGQRNNTWDQIAEFL